MKENILDQIVIREAKQEDLRETVQIYLECIRADYACKPQPYLDSKNVEDELGECEQWLYGSGHPNRVFVAMDGQQMAGYIAVGPNIGQPFDHDGEVCGFFVRKSYRRMGIGLRLMREGITYLQNLGYEKVAIFNYRESEANGFYRRLGGEVVYQETQTPGDKPFLTDVFAYDIATLIATIDARAGSFTG